MSCPALGIIHTALPTLPQTTRIVDVEIAQMAIKRCLNEAIARGAQTVASDFQLIVS